MSKRTAGMSRRSGKSILLIAVGLRYHRAKEEILWKWLLILIIKLLSQSSKDQKHPSTRMLNVGG